MRSAERRLHLRERDPARREHDQQMVDEVGRLRDQPLTILLDRGDHGLDRLLAELLGAMRHALVEELARVGGVRARLRALLYALSRSWRVKFGIGFAPRLHITFARYRKSGVPRARGAARERARRRFTFRAGRLELIAGA